MITARYNLRNGGSGVRIIHSQAEAEKILQGGYSVLDVTLNKDGETIGERITFAEAGLIPDDKRNKWYWWLDRPLPRNQAARVAARVS